MKHLKKIAALSMLSLVAIATTVVLYGQTVTHRKQGTTASTAIELNSSGIVTTSSTSTWNVPSVAFTTTTQAIQDGVVYWTSNRTDIEQRKLKNPLPTLQQVRLTARSLDNPEPVASEYLDLAKQIELHSAATDALRLESAIYDLDLKVYPFESVDDYLYNQALKQNAYMRWVWKPLREKDQKVFEGHHNEMGVGFGFLAGDVMYTHPVPSRVLRTVANILAKLPQAKFLVSDYEAFKPDPFLAVTTETLMEAGKLYIVDMWDEPGYSDDKAKAIPPVKSEKKEETVAPVSKL